MKFTCDKLACGIIWSGNEETEYAASHGGVLLCPHHSREASGQTVKADRFHGNFLSKNTVTGLVNANAKLTAGTTRWTFPDGSVGEFVEFDNGQLGAFKLSDGIFRAL